jgi:multimeric flavodoxin WrbA
MATRPPHSIGWNSLYKEEGHTVERINVGKLKLNGCLGCFKCQESKGFTCSQKDEANSVYERMAAADALVFSSPLYFWGFSTQLKPLIDRFVSQVKNYTNPHHISSVSGKPTALLSTCWGPVENNSECLTTVYSRTMDYLKAVDKGQLVIPECAPNTPPNESYKPRVRELAQKLVG